MKTKKSLWIVIPSVVVVAAIVITVVLLSTSGGAGRSVHVTGNNGQEIATVTKLSPITAEYADPAYASYTEMVLAQAIDLISMQENCSEDEAENILFSGCTVETSFDPVVFAACKSAYDASVVADAEFAVAVADLSGNLLCTFSAGGDINFALEKTQPYSSFKPLSVYAPAIENNVITWSTMFLDAPVKQVKEEDGSYVDWPSNANGKYTNKNTSVADGVKLSLNTVPIRCLQELGVEQSVDFLKTNFPLIDLEAEEQIMSSLGSDEVLSNIGLGYLRAGVSPVDMAGFYQIFANGGTYTQPTAVVRISDSDGKTYEPDKKQRQVISQDTAYIMNKLLQNTLSEGGTAQEARVDGVSIGGKTGTGENNTDNWFVGFTPQYSIAVWHGRSQNGQNTSPSVFSALVAGMDLDKQKSFPACSSVQELAYCCDSGDLLTINCRKMEIGFYKTSFQPENCNQSNH